MNNYDYSDYVLVHSGTKGMKWGQRRYQNEDGTYTLAGKLRYFGQGLMGRQRGSVSGSVGAYGNGDKYTNADKKANYLNARNSANSAYNSGANARNAMAEWYGRRRNALGGFYKGLTGQSNAEARQYGRNYEDDQAARNSAYATAQNLRQKAVNAKNWTKSSISQVKENMGAAYNKASNFVRGIIGSNNKITGFGNDYLDDTKAAGAGFRAGRDLRKSASQKISDLKNSASSAMSRASNWMAETFGVARNAIGGAYRGLTGKENVERKQFGSNYDNDQAAGNAGYELGQKIRSAGKKVVNEAQEAYGVTRNATGSFIRGVTGQENVYRKQYGTDYDNDINAGNAGYEFGQKVNSSVKSAANKAGQGVNYATNAVRGITGAKGPRTKTYGGDDGIDDYKAGVAGYQAGHNLFNTGKNAVKSGYNVAKNGYNTVKNAATGVANKATEAVSNAVNEYKEKKNPKTEEQIQQEMRQHALQAVAEQPIYERYLNEDPDELYRKNREVYEILYGK